MTTTIETKETQLQLKPTTIRLKDGSEETIELTLRYIYDKWWAIKGNRLIDYCLHTAAEAAMRGDGIGLWAGEADWEQDHLSATIMDCLTALDKHEAAGKPT